MKFLRAEGSSGVTDKMGKDYIRTQIKVNILNEIVEQWQKLLGAGSSDDLVMLQGTK
jgi:hypothetical protein